MIVLDHVDIELPGGIVERWEKVDLVCTNCDPPGDTWAHGPEVICLVCSDDDRASQLRSHVLGVPLPKS